MRTKTISNTPRRSWTRADADATRRRVLVLAAAGLKPREIADRIGCGVRTVYRALAWNRGRFALAADSDGASHADAR